MIMKLAMKSASPIVAGYLAVCLSSYVQASELSIITLPMTIDISAIEERLNAEIPKRLAVIRENNLECIPAQWLKTKYPCFKRGKLRSCWLKTKITPTIRCDVNGYIDRRGPFSIEGKRDTLRLSVPLHASATAKKRVIGINLRETAKADAVVSVNLSPSIGENWIPSLDAQSDFKWDKRPTIELFDLIKITIGSKVDPKLRQMLREYEKKLPGIIEELNLKTKIQNLWDKIQQPHAISVARDLYFVFSPQDVGFTGIDVRDEKITLQAFVQGKTEVLLGPKPDVEPVSLLPLRKTSFQKPAFELRLPITIFQEEFNENISNDLMEEITIPFELGDTKGEFSASKFTVSISQDDGILLRADVTLDVRDPWLRFIDVFNWFDISGKNGSRGHSAGRCGEKYCFDG